MTTFQTPVEWLFEQLWDEPKDKLNWYAIREKALEYEKEQLIDFYNRGEIDPELFPDDAEDYYKKMFKK